jgi:hypothetical protein
MRYIDLSRSVILVTSFQQWGNGSTSKATTIKYPISFPNEALATIAVHGAGSKGETIRKVSVLHQGNDSFYFSAENYSCGYKWITVGH